MRCSLCCLAVLTVALATACGDSPTPITPTPPAAPTLVGIQVGIAGNAAPALEPGQSRQFFALGTMSDNTTQDLTNLSIWQSSNPVVATVSSGGLVTAAIEGRVDIVATFSSITGRLGIDVVRPSGECRYTLNPPRLVFSAFGGTASIQVTTSSSECRWRVQSGASWFPYTFDPNRSGNGVFSYTLPGNSTTSPREAEFVIFSGSSAVTSHVVEQERPISCSYVTSPRESRFTVAGGTASFMVITDPSDCRWTASFSTFLGSVSPTSGQGATRITVIARPFTFEFSTLVEIRGLSGQNPPGLHRVVWGNPTTPPFVR